MLIECVVRSNDVARELAPGSPAHASRRQAVARILELGQEVGVFPQEFAEKVNERVLEFVDSVEERMRS